MRIGEAVWHSSRKDIPNAKIAEFDKPTKFTTRCNYLTVMPLVSRGYMEVFKYGEDIDNVWTVIANARSFGGKIKEGDVMWVDGHKPDDDLEAHYGYGCTANAVVKSVSYVNYSMSITLIRNREQVLK